MKILECSHITGLPEKSRLLGEAGSRRKDSEHGVRKLKVGGVSFDSAGNILTS